MGTRDKSCFIENELKKQIAAGEYSTGEALPSETILARKYNVSRMTLRKALKRLKDTGFIDSFRGAGNFIKTRIRDNIAIIASAPYLYSEQGFFYLKLMETAQRLIEKDGFHSSIHLGNDTNYRDSESFLDFLGTAALDSCAGIISMATGTRSEGRTLQSLGFPAVTHSIEVPTLDNCVVLDYGAFIDKALEVFRKNGVSRFACMHWEFPGKHLVPGYAHYALDQLLKSKLGPGVELVPIPYSSDAGDSYEIFKKFWKTPRHPRHILFTDDAFCAHACGAIKELGIKVPEELEIITHGNKGRRFDNPVPMTVIGFDPEEVMNVEWETLKDLIEKKQTVNGRILRLPPRLLDNSAMPDTNHLY